MLDQEHRHAFRSDLFDQLHQLPFFLGRGAGRRLVEQQKVWVAGQGAGDFQAALVAVRQVAGVIVGMLLNPHEVQELHRFLGDAGFLVAGGPRLEQRIPDLGVHPRVFADPDVVERSHVGEQADLLKGPSHAQLRHPIRFQAGNVGPLEDHRA